MRAHPGKMLNRSLQLTRLASSLAKKRPPFYEVFPQKKMVNKLLFQLDSKLTFPKLYPVFESLYDNAGNRDPSELIPTSFKASDVMIMKKVLEKIRHRTKSTNKNLIGLENELLETAAEMGDSDAIALLAFSFLKNPGKHAPEDVLHAKNLIKELYQLQHPLTIKLTADLAVKSNHFEDAERYYLHFLELESETPRAGEVYGQLGLIYFRRPNLKEAERCFLSSIRLCPLEAVTHSYYHLAQLYMDSEPLKARSLMESAASEGFRESFQLLGFLEMNYFHDYAKALQWFRLGMELYQVECYIGYFDCSIKMQDLKKARNCLTSLQKLSKTNDLFASAFKSFVDSRQETINKLNFVSVNTLSDGIKLANEAKDTNTSKDNTWGL